MLLCLGVQEHYSKSQCERCFLLLSPSGLWAAPRPFLSYLPSVVAQGLWNMPIESERQRQRRTGGTALCALPTCSCDLPVYYIYIYILFLNFFFTFVKGTKQQITNDNRKINTRLCFFCEIWNMASICQTELQRVWVSARAQTNRPATLLIDKRLRSVPVSPLLLPPKGGNRNLSDQRQVTEPWMCSLALCM